jgi:hypothetical protein
MIGNLNYMMMGSSLDLLPDNSYHLHTIHTYLPPYHPLHIFHSGLYHIPEPLLTLVKKLLLWLRNGIITNITNELAKSPMA